VLASHLHIRYTDFTEKYCHWVESGDEEHLSLKEKANFDCIFWDNGCTVYGFRPLQCRTFPFWKSVTAGKNAWNAEALSCPGMNQGALHSKDEIEACLADRAAEKIIVRDEREVND
ncbi:MAG: YkgJ family cysteine cluster protein, partial [Treponema sp.]|nr:YkgJ family cysteine cluster protein [Treponema sp.]